MTRDETSAGTNNTKNESEGGTGLAKVITRDVAPGETIRVSHPTEGTAHRVKLPSTDWDGEREVITFAAMGSAAAVRGTLMADARQKPNAFKQTLPDGIVKLYESP